METMIREGFGWTEVELLDREPVGVVTVERDITYPGDAQTKTLETLVGTTLEVARNTYRDGTLTWIKFPDGREVTTTKTVSIRAIKPIRASAIKVAV